MTRISAKASRFTESVIREMTRLAQRHGAINLAQGFPDFAAPEELKRAACAAVAADINQYAITWGARSLREAIAKRFEAVYGLRVDPEREVTVTCGSTEAMIATLLAIVDPEDEVVVFEPFYENYGPDAILSGAVPRFVRLQPPDWAFDPNALADAFTPRTRALILNTPHNPTGKVFSRAELAQIADLCCRHDVVAVTDEIYEHIVYDGARHVPLATLPGMAERTVTISALSKTYSVTGWRVGWTIAPPPLSSAIRKVHDFLTVGAAAPLQEAGTRALSLPKTYYEELAKAYAHRRDRMMKILARCGFKAHVPQGAYYVIAELPESWPDDDVAFGRHLVTEVGVAVVPGSSFYVDPKDGRRQVRFAFCKKDETLDEAERRLARLRSATSAV